MKRDNPLADTRLPAANGELRRAAINPERWYMIARASEIKDGLVGREIWGQPVVLFRNADGSISALEDSCAHRLVRLSDGRMHHGTVECIYHGWRFDTAGKCVHIPHLAGKATLPKYAVRSFPAIEKHGFIWIYPGDPRRAEESSPMPIAEWDDLSQIRSVARLTCRAHFSYLVENLMDMYHGTLHARYQVWTAQSLREVFETEAQVTATYDATTYYQVKGLASMLDLFLPPLRKRRRAALTVTYDYPHWRSTLGDDFKIFCVICPVNEQRTDAYLIHFTSLEKFAPLKAAPDAVRRLMKRALENIAARLLRNLIRQDVLMIEEEQAAFERNPLHRAVEVNRTIRRVQQLILQQAARAPARP